MWLYKIRQHQLFHDDVWVADGYSGFGETGKNMPEAMGLPGIGPIPTGAYLIGSLEEDEHIHGPLAFHLVAETGTRTFGRFGFMVHGDSVSHPGAASHGCIVLGKAVRETMIDSRDKQLVVISGVV